MSIDRHRHTLNGATMGTRWSATFYATAATDLAAVRDALAQVVDRVDAQMSTWQPASDLMRFNAAPTDTWIALPAELLQVLDRGLAIGRASGGAFDVGLGDLVAAWGFGAAGDTPDADAIRRTRQVARSPAHATLELDLGAGRARKRAPCTLDLSGIAKGFAVDEMTRTLGIFGIGSALVALDGEVRACGMRPDGAPWVVAVEKPDHEVRSAWGTLALHDAAAATSGDYRHWLDVGGARLGHTMERARGGPVANGVASVTVVAATCTDADAWATALLVLGPEAGAPLARAHGLDALFLCRRGDQIVEFAVGERFASRSPVPIRVGSATRAASA